MFHCLDPWCKQEKPTLVGKGIHEKDIEELTETVQSLERPENVMGGNQGRSGEARIVRISLAMMPTALTTAILGQHCHWTLLPPPCHQKPL